MGRTYTKAEILRRVGDLSQLGGTRHMTLAEGTSRGVDVVEADTGAGLCFTVVPGRGMDISRASWRGINLVHRTPAGEAHPAFYNPNGDEWLRTFFAGLLTTCGLTHLGAPGIDEGESLGLHGRYSATPARRWADLSGWVGDEYEIRLSGIMEEAALFKDKLRLTRTISARLGENRLLIEDEVENFGYRPAPLTILYHVNAGFPLLSGSAELLPPASCCEPCDEVSARAVEKRLRFTEPEDQAPEHNFLYPSTPDAEGMAWAAVVNPALAGGVGLYLKYRAAELPFLNQWKMMAPGEYVLGIEPCNVPCENRAVLRHRGMLPSLKGGECRRFRLEIGVLENIEQIDALRRHMAEAQGASSILK